MSDKVDLSEFLDEARRLQRFRDEFWADRRRALDEAFEFVSERVRPVVNEEIRAIREDENLEPKPGYMVSGMLFVNQTLAIASFLFGDCVTVRDSRYGDFSTYPRKVSEVGQ